MPTLQITQLDKTRHDRTGFDCGEPALNRYLATQAAKDMQRRASGCWVLTSIETPAEVLGYYTLSPEAVDAMDLPELPKTISKKLPGYRRFGAALLGRLAVSKNHQRQGLGKHLLMDALLRCFGLEVPVVVILVDPKDASVAEWYARYGFRPLTESRMVVTLLEIEARINELDSHR